MYKLYYKSSTPASDMCKEQFEREEDMEKRMVFLNNIGFQINKVVLPDNTEINLEEN